MDCARQLAKAALEIRAIRLNWKEPFTWASGYRMPVYNDNRLLLSRAEHRQLVAQGFQMILQAEGIQPDLVAGVATAGIPHATTLADKLECPLIYVRDKPKSHGMGNQIEGIPQGGSLEGKRVVVIEDLISTGGSSVKAVEAVRARGGQADHCLAIFSYGLTQSAEAFSRMIPPCKLLPILTLKTLLKVVEESDAETARRLWEWQKDPFGWGEKNGFPKI